VGASHFFNTRFDSSVNLRISRAKPEFLETAFPTECRGFAKIEMLRRHYRLQRFLGIPWGIRHIGRPMQFVRDIYAAKAATRQPVISFEFFPPKTEEGDRNLLEKTLPALLQTRPDYCSVTYGAGGSTREKTLMIVDRIQKQHQLTAVAHLTCVDATREQIGGLLTQIRSLGVKNVLALRGDPPGGGEFKTTPGGFEFSNQLVEFIRCQNGFCIGVAGFPEGHIACKDGKHVDWQHLKMKIEAGADFVITQLFFDNQDFYAFRDEMVRRHGAKIPLVPGIVPILSATQIKKFTALCGARIPAELASKLDQLGDDDAAVTQFGIEYAARQCADLLKNGAPGIHFYTLNKAYSTVQVLKQLGLFK
jgi:methylenetetrahydrofolate reductase (NADPH)